MALSMISRARLANSAGGSLSERVIRDGQDGYNASGPPVFSSFPAMLREDCVDLGGAAISVIPGRDEGANPESSNLAVLNAGFRIGA
jgi:hypothetical protein